MKRALFAKNVIALLNYFSLETVWKMSNHKNINDDEEFGTVMASAGNKLVVVDFNATWCGPCQKIHPVFIQLAHKFPQALFLGVSIIIRQFLCFSYSISSGNIIFKLHISIEFCFNFLGFVQLGRCGSMS